MLAVEKISTDRAILANMPADKLGENVPAKKPLKKALVQKDEVFDNEFLEESGVPDEEFVKNEVQEKDVVLDDAETEKLANATDTMLLQDLCIEDQDIVGQYFRQAGDHTLLTREEETTSFIAIEQGRKKRVELFDFAGSESEKQELFYLIDEGLKAEQYVVHHNLKLVISIAKKYINHGLPFGDLIQEGNLGLLRAMKKFDYRKGNKFSTYATFWIRRDILEACAEKVNTIRYPEELIEEIAHMEKMKYLYGTEHEELAKKLGIKPERVEFLEGIQVQRRVANLGEPSKQLLSSTSGCGDPAALEDSISSSVDTEVQSDRHVIGELLRTFLSDILTPTEYTIVVSQYALTEDNALDEAVDAYGMRQKAIGEALGIPESKVGSLKQAAFFKIRRYLDRHQTVAEQLKTFISPQKES